MYRLPSVSNARPSGTRSSPSKNDSPSSGFPFSSMGMRITLPANDSATYRQSLSGEGHPVDVGHGPVVPEPSFSALQVESPDSRSFLLGIVTVGDVQAVPGAVYHGKVGDAHLVPSPAV